MYMPFSLGQWNPLLRRLPEGQSGVALTYDDGPTPETTPRLLEQLAGHQATATFFLTGERVEAHPDLVAAVIAAGHEVYGHGWHHRDFAATPKQAAAEMARVEAVLARFRPTPDPYLVRLPYFAGYNRASIHRALAEFHPNIQFAWWSHSVYDWRLPNAASDIQQFHAACRAAVDALVTAPDLDGGIVLLHEQPIGIDSPFNVEAAALLLPWILDGLARRALKTVPLRPARQHSLLRRCVLLPAA